MPWLAGRQGRRFIGRPFLPPSSLAHELVSSLIQPANVVASNPTRQPEGKAIQFHDRRGPVFLDLYVLGHSHHVVALIARINLSQPARGASSSNVASPPTCSTTNVDNHSLRSDARRTTAGPVPGASANQLLQRCRIPCLGCWAPPAPQCDAHRLLPACQLQQPLFMLTQSP